MSGELGEFNELIKKLLFHGKDFNEEYEERMKSELADIMWYWTQICLAMEWDPNEVIALNVEKLKSRHLTESSILFIRTGLMTKAIIWSTSYLRFFVFKQKDCLIQRVLSMKKK